MTDKPGKPKQNSQINERANQESLDPENWDEMRALGHRMVDDAIDYLKTVSERPVWQAMPQQLGDKFSSTMPLEPTAADDVYEEFLENIFPYPMGNIHPRFWAWYMGSGTIFGALADFMSATMNSNVGAGSHVANLVEAQVVDWMKELIGFPQDASGLLVGGASMANLVGLTVARNTQAGFNVRAEGLCAGQKKLLIYASSEIHSCNQKAVELLGMGADSLRRIPVNANYQIDMQALAEEVEKDRAAGLQPVCVIATAGTVNTGAIDPLDDIADFCEAEGLWFHVDGAIGAVATLVDSLKAQLAGISRADSIALDLHKWMHVPFEAGCALVKNREAHRDTFAVTPEYLGRNDRGLAAGREWFSDYGVELSRSFRALKVWMSLKEHGASRYGRMMERNIEQANYLGELINQDPNFELMAPIGLDIVCFRYRPQNLREQDLGAKTLEESALEALNKEILFELQEQGIAAPSCTTLNGKYSLRVAIANHRSQFSDFDLLMSEINRLGKSLTK
ncbi:MAG: amino acid decarboxylase [Cellvibrionales bacterium]|nr:MAG: amino acid decarboxylase [Cellvibrionales bacterium]